MKIFKTILLSLSLISLLLLATAGAWIYSQVDGSLPMLEGKTTLWGLSDTALIERDRQGIATIKAKSRLDIAVATGFIHAQERFFQMDLLRRNAAGELSSLFGEVALGFDKRIRVHRFRDRARQILQHLPEEQLALLKAYTQGVNQGLSELGAPPFEYLLLRQDPVEWQEEDSILAVYSMYIDLQDAAGERERTLGALQAILPKATFDFLNPKGSRWDAALDGSNLNPAPMPGNFWRDIPSLPLKVATPNALPQQKPESATGSNNWAVSGQLTATGSAMLANDMHLGLRVPNTWFRASFEYTDGSKNIKITGLTLPGTPNMVVGSNGDIAWGFTNSYGDWSDVIRLKTTADQRQYLTPQGYQPFNYHKQLIAVKGEDAVEIEVRDTIWGPVIGQDGQGNLLAYRWVAHDDNAVNLTLVELEQANSVNQAFDIASRAGMPEQNMVIADRQGQIGWTIIGPMPMRSANFGATPSDWSDGQRNWHGYYAAADYPRILNPEQQRIWTANARVVSGEALAKIGNGGYALGARAQQIRDDLLAQSSFSEQQLLGIALDERALFLTRWRDFILNHLLDEQALQRHPDWREVKAVLSKESELHASTDSVAYRLVRNFRLNTRSKVFNALDARLKKYDNKVNLYPLRHQLEVPLWQLVNEQPKAFLSGSNDSWAKLLDAALVQTIQEMTDGQSLSQATWGQQNTSHIMHPLSKALPILSSWLDMPATELAGDSYMPRVQGPDFGASERMVVSPGHEQDGILNMPTSQSSHPWSPYYRLGHSDWEQGKPSPFLPGKTKYSLTLLSY